MASLGISPRSRSLFCLKNEKILIVPESFDSHLAWFRHERWISDGGGDEPFFRQLVMGSYLPEENALYCFHEIDFSSDLNKDVVEIVSRNLFRLKQVFHFSDDTKIFLGPEGGGTLLGTAGALLKKVTKGE